MATKKKSATARPTCAAKGCRKRVPVPGVPCAKHVSQNMPAGMPW